MSKYAKAIVALLGALATWGITAAEDNVYSQVEIWGAVLALSTAAAVWLTPNKQEYELDSHGYSSTENIVVFVIGLILGFLLCKVV